MSHTLLTVLLDYDNRSYTESAFSYVPPIYSSQSSATVPTTAPVYHNATQLTPYSSNHTRATYENSSESYLNVGAAQLPDVTGYSPHKGVVGTKLYVYITASYELLTTNLPSFYLEFGHQKCQASLQKTSQQSASSYTITCDVPPFLSTNSARSTVTISLAMDSEDNDSTGKVIVGDFLYIDTGDESLYDNPREQSISRKRNRSFVSPELMKTPLKRTHSQHLRPKQEYSAYSYSQSDSLAACPTFTQQPNAQYNTSMVSPYGRPAAGYPAQVARRQAYEYPGSVSSAIKTSQSPHLGISNFGFPNINPSMSQSPGIMTNGSMNRSTSSSYPPPGPQENPELVRATLIPASSPSSAQHGPTYGNHVNFPAKVKLEIVGENVESMGDTRTWSREEFDLQRRLVHFSRTQSGSNVRAVCTAVSQEMKPGQGKEYATISAIHWKEKDLCYVTSVDVILLLEKLVGYKFTVEEKNRIRRNLEGYHPVTVSKGKTESEEFFKTIMGFPEPKPRNIEKDVKAFKWSDLVQALNKIMGKFVSKIASIVCYHSDIDQRLQVQLQCWDQ